MLARNDPQRLDKVVPAFSGSVTIDQALRSPGTSALTFYEVLPRVLELEWLVNRLTTLRSMSLLMIIMAKSTIDTRRDHGFETGRANPLAQQVNVITLVGNDTLAFEVFEQDFTGRHPPARGR
jgi:hypothetical protein